jgi:hypothetical protein
VSRADGKGRGDGRDTLGRFTRSGNPRGRPRKPDPSLPAARRDAISRVAERRLSVRVTGGPSGREEVVEMSFYEACLYRIALEGASGNRIAARAFVELVMQNSIMIERHERMDAERERRLGLLSPEANAYFEGAEKRRDEFLARIDKLYGLGRDDDDSEGETDPGGTPGDPPAEG